MKMPEFKPRDRRSAIQKELDFYYEALSEMEVDDPNYEKYLKRIDELLDLEAKRSGKSSVKREKLSPNTLLVVGGTIAEILLIMNHEKVDVIATKAWSRINRAKL